MTTHPVLSCLDGMPGPPDCGNCPAWPQWRLAVLSSLHAATQIQTQGSCPEPALLPSHRCGAVLWAPRVRTHTVTCVGLHGQFLSSPSETSLLPFPRHTHPSTSTKPLPHPARLLACPPPGTGWGLHPCPLPSTLPIALKTAVMDTISLLPKCPWPALSHASCHIL